MLFKPKKIAESFGGDFAGYEPLKLNTPEATGLQSHIGPTLDYIRVGGGKGKVQPMLDMKLKLLIESSWKHAKPTDGAMRGDVFAGSHRTMHPSAQPQMAGHFAPAAPNMPKMPPLPLRPGEKPAVAMDQQYRHVSPIDFSDRVPAAELQKMQKPQLNQHEADSKFRYLMNQVPDDWKIMRSLPLVSAYSFRGDTRNPNQIQGANGFSAPITRTDDHYIKNCVWPTFNAYIKAKLGVGLTFEDFRRIINTAMPDPQERLLFSFYEMWRGQVASESMHLGRMLAKEDLKGYVSTSRSPNVAKGFAKPGGFVYVTLVRTGFLVPGKKEHDWTEIFGEEEIASPNPIAWNDIVAFRKVGHGTKFEGPAYVRPGLFARDSAAFEKIFRALSGKHTI